MRMLPLVSRGNYCPRCSAHTYRVRMPLLLRPMRSAFPHVQRRACINRACLWHGFVTAATDLDPLRHPAPAMPDMSDAEAAVAHV